MSIRNKIVILFTAVAALIALLLSIFIYVFTSQHIERDFFQRMNVRAGIAGKAKFDANDNNIVFYNEIREKHLQRLPEEKEYILNFPLQPNQVPEGFNTTNLLERKIINRRVGDDYYLSTVYNHEGKNYAVLLFAWNKVGGELLSNLKNNLIVGCFVSLVIVFILGLLLSKEVVNPIRHIIANVKVITASNLHLRLKQPIGKDETADLTQTFNDMLDRLETSFETQSNFLNKAAHELRTPLTAIIGEAELALSKPRTAQEYSTALQIISREAEQLEHHTSSLLELAQAGYNSKEPFMGLLRLDELLFSVKRLIDFTEPDNKVQIHLDELPEIEDKITIIGNTNLLKLALSNIIQNASKYSNSARVIVSLITDNEHAVIIVQDEGIGIPEKELKYIFDPFFRASNTTPFKGYGVGLPLAQKIIRLHRGELSYHSRENEGTTVHIFFPFISR